MKLRELGTPKEIAQAIIGGILFVAFWLVIYIVG